MTDYLKITKSAGYKGEKAAYIAHKLEEKQVPVNRLNQLGLYIRGERLAGIQVSELSAALYEAATKKPPRATKKSKRASKTIFEDTAVPSVEGDS